MARAYGVDLCKRVIEAIEAGVSTRAAARRFAIGFSTAGSWHRDWCRKGTFEPDRHGQPEGSKIDAHEAFILALIDTDEKDISLAEITERLEADKGVSACQSLISSFFKKRSITWKKTAHAAKQQRDDVLAAREAWFETQLDLDPSKLVFIDESGLNTKMARLRGRSKRGERCRVAVI